MMYQPGSGAQETPGLEEYLTAIVRRKLLIVATLLVGLGVAWLYLSSRTPIYAAEANVIVNPTNVNSTNGQLVRPVLEREREVAASNAVAADVISDLGLDIGPAGLLRDLEVRFVDSSDALDLVYQSETALQAQLVVNSFATAYVARRVSEADQLDATLIGELQVAVDGIDEQIATIDAELLGLAAERARLVALEEPVSLVADQQVDARAQLNNLRAERRGEAAALSDAIIASNTRAVPAEVLRFSEVPTTPQGLSDNVIWVVGGFLGAVGGIALAFVLQRLDRRARGSLDVELALGTSVLASVPKFAFGNRGGPSSVVMLAGGKAPKVQAGRESFRRLRAAVLFLGRSSNAKKFMLTSARPGEGKSTTAINLAVSLAQGGTSVCLVNFDLRRPRVEELLGLPKDRGLTNWLADPSDTDIIVGVDGVENLTIVPCGPIPANPGELLASARIGDLLTELALQVEIVLVDTPPVLSAADATAVAQFVDGTIIVVDGHQTGTDTLLKIRSDIERAGGRVLGAVLNRDRTVGRFSFRRDRYAYERASARRDSGS